MIFILQIATLMILGGLQNHFFKIEIQATLLISFWKNKNSMDFVNLQS